MNDLPAGILPVNTRAALETCRLGCCQRQKKVTCVSTTALLRPYVAAFIFERAVAVLRVIASGEDRSSGSLPKPVRRVVRCVF